MTYVSPSIQLALQNYANIKMTFQSIKVALITESFIYEPNLKPNEQINIYVGTPIALSNYFSSNGLKFKIGLFDEYFYPIYFEDNDFHERVARFCPENTILSTDIKAAPETGSQTINSDDKLMNRNHQTFEKNREYYQYKQKNNFENPIPWSLSRRRDQEWLR